MLYGLPIVRRRFRILNAEGKTAEEASDLCAQEVGGVGSNDDDDDCSHFL